jgi:hypothetical protein
LPEPVATPEPESVVELNREPEHVEVPFSDPMSEGEAMRELEPPEVVADPIPVASGSGAIPAPTVESDPIPVPPEARKATFAIVRKTTFEIVKK